MPVSNKLYCLILLTLTVLAGLAPAHCEDAQKAPTVEQGQGNHVNMKTSLPNFHEVHPYLYRGGQPDNAGVDQLHHMGIKTVIDLRAPTPVTRVEKARVESLSMHYIDLPMSDKAPTKAQVDTFMSTVKKGRENNAPVFVHCAHGSDRTGCMVGIWRVSEDGYSYEQAYKEMLKYWFGPKFVKLSAAVRERAAK